MYTDLGRPMYTDLGRPMYTDLGRPMYTDLGRPMYTDLGRYLNCWNFAENNLSHHQVTIILIKCYFHSLFR